MVRSATSRQFWRTLDSARIAAIAAAICVHVGAFGLLTIPPAPPVMVQDAGADGTAAITAIGVPKIRPTPPVMVKDAGADGTDGIDDYLHWVISFRPPAIVEHFPWPIYHHRRHRIDDLPVSSVDGSLQEIVSPAPTYPADAFHEGVSGTVTLELLVGIDGHVLRADIERTSGDRRLDRVAREQVLRRWRFRPTVRNGLPVQTLARVPVQFVLGDRQASPKR